MRSKNTTSIPRRLLFVVAIVAMIVPVVTIPTAVLAGSPCRTSETGPYQVTVCLTTPIDGTSVTGVEVIEATASATGNFPGIRRAVFYLDGEYLLTDVTTPYSFDLPTDRWIDGTYVLEVELLLRDGFVTDRATIDLTFANGVTTPPVNTNTFTPSAGSTPEPGQPFVLTATGDGAGGRPGADAVADLISGWNPNMFLYLGDVYEKGTITEFFNWYGHNEQGYSAFREITNPVIGNHEYENGIAPGYFDYWDNIPDYYSYDAAGWHFIALNSTSKFDERDPGSAQYQWLENDLSTSSSSCTIAYLHHPVLSIGPQGDTPELNAMWQLLADNGVDIVLSGHDHQYQRWTPLNRDLLPDPNGMTEFVAGAGGHGIQAVVGSDSRVAAVADNASTAYGSLKFELNSDGATFAYVNTLGTILDAGVIPCRDSGPDTQAPTAPGNLTANPLSHYQVALDWSSSTDDTGVAAYTIYRDGTELASGSGATTSFTDETASSGTTYSYEVDAVDQAGNHSAAAGPIEATTAEAPGSVSYQPVADAYVNEANSASKYGTSTLLRVDADPLVRSYLRFDVAGLEGPPVTATLRVFSNSSSSAGYDVHGGATNTWDETTITYATAPGFDSAVAGTSGVVSMAAWSEVDVTSLISGNGSYTIVLTGISNTAVSLASRESANPPELLISTGSGGPPVAGDVAVTTDEDTATEWVPVVSDPDGDALTCTIVDTASFGSATVAPDCSSGTYTPNPDATDADTFVYQVGDAAFTDTGTVTVTVTPVNDTPTAVAAAVAVTQDQAVTITLTGSDVDGDCPLGFSVVTPPTNGVLGAVTDPTCVDGSASADVLYTLNGGYTGGDSFTFVVDDPSGDSSTPADVTLTVDPLQTSFAFTTAADAYVDASKPDSNYGTRTSLRIDASPERRAYFAFDVQGLTGPVTNATLRIYTNSSSSIGLDASTTQSIWDESTLTFTNAPAVGALLDSSGAFSRGTWVTVDVTAAISGDGDYSFAVTTPSNTAVSLASRESANPPELLISTGSGGPPVAGDVPVTTDEDTATDWVPVVSDPDGDALTCTIVDTASFGSATVAPDCSSGTYTPNPDATGPDTFVYQVGDAAFTDTGTVTVTVTPVNDTPTAVAAAVAVTQDQAVTITLTGSDVDGDCPLGFSVVTPPTNGVLGAVTDPTCVDGSASADVLYTPNDGYTGGDSFTFVVDDPSGDSSTPADVTLTVDPLQTSFAFTTAADAYVDASKPDSNYGTRTSLRIDASPERRAYFAFDVQGLTGPVTNATLRIYTNSSSSIGLDASTTQSIWDESTLTFTNAPAVGTLLDSSGAFSRGTWVTVDVTAAISGDGDYSFAVTTPSNTAVSLASRESANPSELLISTGSGG